MKPGIATALLFLLAVPYQTFWQDYEIARRGAMALLVGVLCLFPGSMPRRVPAIIWPFNALALYVLARSIAVENFGYAMEASCHMLALAALVIFGSGLSMRSVLRAALPTGIVVAGVGIAQGFGFTLMPDTTEAVSTLGNRNVASELLAVCGAAAALLASTEESEKRDRGFALATLTLCAMAIVLNGSRSGLLALPLGCLPCMLHKRRWPMLIALALGLLLGSGKSLVVPRPAPPPASVAADGAVPISAPGTEPGNESAPSTVAVRLALWRGGLAMFATNPFFGYGGGQFLIRYPRFRTIEEIELSSFGRRFETSPASVHNDYLQILIDYGIVGFLLAATAAYVTLRVTPIRMWGPFLAFLMLACVRAPLGNAPTVALVALFAGAMIRRQHTPDAKEFSLSPRRQVVKALVFGLLMIWFGGGPLLSQVAATGYVRQMRTREDWTEAMASIERALFFRPYDANFRLERGKDRMKRKATLPEARNDIEYLLRTASGLPEVQIQHALLLNAEGDPRGAMKILNFLRVYDPENQRAIQISALILVRNHQVNDAVMLLYRSRHPRTRASLAKVLGGLTAQSKTAGDKNQLLREQAFVQVLDQIAIQPAAKPAIDATRRFFKLSQLTSGSGQKDMRGFVLMAALQLALHHRADAESIAGVATGRSLLPIHRRMMKAAIEDLLRIPAWRDLLGDQ